MAARSVLGIVVFVLLAGSANAQTAVGQITDTYPFTQCFAVTSADNNRVWTGTGSGVFVFDAPSGEPSLAAGVANELRPGGIVREIAATDDHLYVAAGRGGLVRYQRDDPTSSDPQWSYSDPDFFTEVWAVDAPTRVNSTDLIFIGTNDGATGSLRLFHADSTQPTPSVEKDAVTYSAPVHAIASHVAGNSLTVLVGTSCTTISGGGTIAPGPSVHRYDFDLSGGLPTSIPTESANWVADRMSGSTWVTVPTFVRDIAIEPDGSAAYVAAMTNGFFRLDLAGHGLVQDLSTGWPIEAPNGQVGRADGVAVSDGSFGHVLAVAFGPKYRDEQQVWGDCSDLLACDDPVAGNFDGGYSGLRLYDLSGGAPSFLASLEPDGCADGDPDCLAGNPQKVALREVSGPALLVDLADETGGYEVARADGTPPTVTMERKGSWNKSDGLPLGSNDDLLKIRSSLVVAFESGLSVYDLNAGDPLGHPVDTDYGPAAILLTGFDAVGGYPALVFGSAQTHGSNIWEVVNPGTSSVSLNYLGGYAPEGARVYVHHALDASQTPDGKPWLFQVKGHDLNTLAGCPEGVTDPNASILVSRIVMQGGQVKPRATKLLGAFRPSACEDPSQGGNFFGMSAAPAGGNDVVVWVAYGPGTNGTSGGVTYGELNEGLLVLKATFVPGATEEDDQVVFNCLGKSVAIAYAPATNLGRLTWDPDTQRVNAAFGCNGMAAWDVSSLLAVPSAPLGSWPPAGSGLAGSMLQVVPGPAPWVYATDLSGTIWVLDGSQPQLGPAGAYQTRSQANALWPTPSGLGGNPPPPAFFLADGRGGVDLLQFLTLP